MEPRKRTDKIEVNLGDIFGLLLHRMWMILLAGFICGADRKSTRLNSSHD